MFTRLLTLPDAAFKRGQTGRLLNRFTVDAGAITSTATEVVTVIFRDVLVVLVLLGVLLVMSWQLTLIVLVTLPLSTLIARIFIRRLRKINRELGLTIVLITHQMQVIKQIADRMAVLDGGKIVEMGSVLEVFTRPQQAITRSLIDEIVPQHLPESVLAHVRRCNGQLNGGVQGRLLRLVYAGDNAYQPVLSHLIRELGLEVSILHGQIDEVAEQPFGSLAVYVRGSQAQIDHAVAHLQQDRVQVRQVPVAG